MNPPKGEEVVIAGLRFEGDSGGDYFWCGLPAPFGSMSLKGWPKPTWQAWAGGIHGKTGTRAECVAWLTEKIDALRLALGAPGGGSAEHAICAAEECGRNQWRVVGHETVKLCVTCLREGLGAGKQEKP